VGFYTDRDFWQHVDVTGRPGGISHTLQQQTLSAIAVNRSRAASFSGSRTIAVTACPRSSGDQLLADANGQSHISVQDFATAMIDELERPAHIRRRFTVGYCIFDFILLDDRVWEASS